MSVSSSPSRMQEAIDSGKHQPLQSSDQVAAADKVPKGFDEHIIAIPANAPNAPVLLAGLQNGLNGQQ